MPATRCRRSTARGRSRTSRSSTSRSTARRATARSRSSGCSPPASRAIVVLGGDGTHRVVARACGDVPICALSTGTNNAFPEMREATVAGLAAGLVATGRAGDGALRREAALAVDVPGAPRDLALVDVAVSRERFIGARALWRAGERQRALRDLREPERGRAVGRRGRAVPAPARLRARPARPARARRGGGRGRRPRRAGPGPRRPGRRSPSTASSRSTNRSRSPRAPAPSPSTASARSSAATASR